MPPVSPFCILAIMDEQICCAMHSRHYITPYRRPADAWPGDHRPEHLKLWAMAPVPLNCLPEYFYHRHGKLDATMFQWYGSEIGAEIGASLSPQLYLLSHLMAFSLYLGWSLWFKMI